MRILSIKKMAAALLLYAPLMGVYAQNPPFLKSSSHIGAEFDDLEEYVVTGRHDLGSSDLELGWETVGNPNSAQLVGLRFANVRVPFGAIVTRAYIQFAKDNNKDGNPCNLFIKIHNLTNAPTFDTTRYNIRNRPTIADSVAWSPASWVSLPVHGKSQDERTPDLSRLVQAVISQKTWRSGNALSFVISGVGTREAESYDGATQDHKNPKLAPELVIEYVVPITQWNFNGNSTGTTSPSIGSGKASLFGSATATFASGTASGGSTDTLTTSSNYAWNTTNYTTDPSGVRFDISTVGFENIIVSFDVRFSNTASRFLKLQYTTDSVNFVDYNGDFTDTAGLYRAAGGDMWKRLIKADLTNISGVANNAKFGFRIIPAKDPVSGNFVAANRNSSFSTSGTLRYDMVTVSGSPASAFRLQVLHASDLEAGIEAVQDAPRFAAIIDTLEETYPNTLVLSSGDNFIPSPFLSASEDASMQTPLRTAVSSYFSGTHAVRASIGRADIAILNIIGFKAAALGNHEFDLGTSELNNLIGVDIRSSGADRRWVGAQFPYLSANLDFSADLNLKYLFTDKRLNVDDFKTPTNITSNSQKRGLAPSAIAVVGGQRIGLVGATTQVLQSISQPSPTRVIGPTTNDMPELAKILQPVIDSLLIAEKVDKVILLAHLQQLRYEEELARLLRGVDMIIAGGSHTLLADEDDKLRSGDVAAKTYPLITTGADGKTCLIVNTAANYRYVGRIVLDFDAKGELLPHYLNPAINGAYATDSAGLARVWGTKINNALAPNTKGGRVKALCDALANVINTKDGNIFGRSDVFLEGRRGEVRTQETNLGNLSADANLWWARKFDKGVTVSLKNGGGIRSAIGEVYAVGDQVELRPTAPNPTAKKKRGDISQLDIENSLRFNNRLWVITTDAEGLKKLIEHGVSATRPGSTPGQFPQVAGIRFSYDTTKAAGSRIRNMVVLDSLGNASDTIVFNGSLYGSPTRTIKIVTLNFLATGGDNYPFPTVRRAPNLALDSIANPPAGRATFTVPGSEQDAFAEYMAEFFTNAGYAIPDRPINRDTRIQLVQSRTDSVFDATTVWNGVTWSAGAPDSTKVAVIAGNYNTAINGDISALRIRINTGHTITLSATGKIMAKESILNMGTIQNCAKGTVSAKVLAGAPVIVNTASEPATQASAIKVTPIYGNKLNITWTPGSGSNRLVVLKAGSAVSATAAQDGITYVADANFGGNGSSLDGGKVVYKGNGNSVEVSGLNVSDSYFIGIFEYNTDPFCGPNYAAGTLSTTGITGLEPETAGAKIYPNPAKDILNVEVNGRASLRIISLTGATIQVAEVENRAALPLDSLAKGLYLVEIATEKGRATSKLIVE